MEAITSFEFAQPDETTPPAAEAALHDAFVGHRQRLARIAASLVGNDAAEDIVHDTYVVARERLAQLRDQGAMEAWLTRICVNRCFEHHRRRRRHERAVTRLEPSGGHPLLELRDLIEQLQPRARTVVVLHYGHGYSLLEIASILSISYDSTRAIISRARRRLLEQWVEEQG